MEEYVKQNSNIIVENRKKFTITGVKECLNFDDETIIIDTVLGRITIKGDKLHITNFDTKTGEISAEGRLHAIAYTIQNEGGSFLSKIFK